jgi:hypothetical protein
VVPNRVSLTSLRNVRALSSTPSRLWLLAVVAFALAGCGGGGDPSNQVVGAARKTLALHWVRYDLTFEHPQLFAPSIRVVGSRGAVNLQARLSYAFLDLQRRDNGSQVLWLDLTPTTLLVDPEPPPAGMLPAGKVWISAPLSGADALAVQAEGLGPELPLDEISWGTQGAAHVSSSVVGHVPTDQYRVTVDLRKARTAAEKAHLDTVAAAISGELHASASPRLSLLVWVNGPGYVSRIDEVIPGAKLGAVSLLFTNFRLRYTGTLPSPAHVVPLSSLSLGTRSVWAAATGS